ncbi:hypothetical protein [Thermococcus sp.]|uniref:hypothetical protein n=1 Tax=Thermococcus sp. TaxID=35749 RepID=UPI00261867ED|nr:hypothetical protein [Thermococcus sp.]
MGNAVGPLPRHRLLLWYFRKDIPGSLFLIASVVVYLPEFRKKWIRWMYGVRVRRWI